MHFDICEMFFIYLLNIPVLYVLVLSDIQQLIANKTMGKKRIKEEEDSWIDRGRSEDGGDWEKFKKLNILI